MQRKFLCFQISVFLLKVKNNLKWSFDLWSYFVKNIDQHNISFCCCDVELNTIHPRWINRRPRISIVQYFQVKHSLKQKIIELTCRLYGPFHFVRTFVEKLRNWIFDWINDRLNYQIRIWPIHHSAIFHFWASKNFTHNCSVTISLYKLHL